MIKVVEAVKFSKLTSVTKHKHLLMVKIESKATCKHFYVAQGHFDIKKRRCCHRFSSARQQNFIFIECLIFKFKLQCYLESSLQY